MLFIRCTGHLSPTRPKTRPGRVPEPGFRQPGAGQLQREGVKRWHNGLAYQTALLILVQNVTIWRSNILFHWVLYHKNVQNSEYFSLWMEKIRPVVRILQKQEYIFWLSFSVQFLSKNTWTEFSSLLVFTCGKKIVPIKLYVYIQFINFGWQIMLVNENNEKIIIGIYVYHYWSVPPNFTEVQIYWM